MVLLNIPFPIALYWSIEKRARVIFSLRVSILSKWILMNLVYLTIMRIITIEFQK